ncbi:hypothetical protein EBR25_12445, partial [bacterium]|nr:hypothetical protein [bacterium]
YDFNDPILREGRTESAEQRAKRIKRGPKYDAAVKRYKAYAERVLGMQFNSDEEVRESYDNMPITSQVALNESEVARNADESKDRASAALRLRRFASKAAKTYPGARNEILQNPQSYYSKQSLSAIKNSLATMTDQETK